MQDMTKGSILSHLISYAIPMILGNLLQLTYNAADSRIIGKFLGENALSAVSTSGVSLGLLHRLGRDGSFRVQPVFLLAKDRKNPNLIFPFRRKMNII